MPKFTVWSVRLAFTYLLIGFTFGAILLANKGVPFLPGVWTLLPVHIEFLLLGWLAQLVFGVAFWIMPRLSHGSRGNERIAWLSLILLNIGVLCVAAQVFPASRQLFYISGRVFETGSVILFAIYIWSRIRPFPVSKEG